MSKMLRTVVGAVVVAAAGFSPMAAFADTPLGVYQTTDRKMDFSLALCGKTGKELCVTLSGLRGDADIPRTHAYLNKFVVDHARPAGNNTWKGSMIVQQYKLDGTLELNPGTKFVMHGCAYVVVCQDFTLIPAK